jgi:hypothetical protein
MTKSVTVKSFAALAAAIQEQDVQRANALRKTQAARAANRARRAAKPVKRDARFDFVDNPA